MSDTFDLVEMLLDSCPDDRCGDCIRCKAAEEITQLRAQVGQLVSTIDNEMVVSHLGVFNLGDDPKDALNKLMRWSQDLGAFFAQDKLEQLTIERDTLNTVVREIAEELDATRQTIHIRTGLTKLTHSRKEVKNERCRN